MNCSVPRVFLLAGILALSGSALTGGALAQSEGVTALDLQFRLDHAETQRERIETAAPTLDVLKLMAQGLSNGQIADVLAISESTVKYHIGILFRALQVRSRTACVNEAYRRQLIER